MVPFSEFSDRFVEYMKNRMEVSFHKYGAIADAFPTKIDALKSAADRIEQYRVTHNTEFLVDAANFLMIEFMLPGYHDAFFKGTDSSESPGRHSITYGDKSQRPNDKV